MKLRDDPALIHSGVPAWPPVWIHTRTKPFKRVEGEIGTFTGTVLNHGLPRAIFLKSSTSERTTWASWRAATRHFAASSTRCCRDTSVAQSKTSATWTSVSLFNRGEITPRGKTTGATPTQSSLNQACSSLIDA
jgi:hypothetical protein